MEHRPTMRNVILSRNDSIAALITNCFWERLHKLNANHDDIFVYIILSRSCYERYNLHAGAEKF